ncbi:hypothetical protein [Mycobacterium sp. E1747]|uniref:hypothetical protein n=1 Tax=Mycobacterium sp. E1747 TaxID=1834128 RepID=UPI0012EA9670|nr:hypothetical protein [Mycobacterium sp. E1747]
MTEFRQRGRPGRVVSSLAFVCAGVAAMTLSAPTAAAGDAYSELKSQFDTARAAAGCPPLRLDDLLASVSNDAVNQMVNWIKHKGRFLPMEDKTVASALQARGFTPVHSRLVTGYGDYRTGGPGDDQSKAIQATIVQGRAYQVFENCTYTKYGLSIMGDGGEEGWPSTIPRSFVVTSVVLSSD